MQHVESWIRAFRLRTLPLSLSSVFLGSFMAVHEGRFSGAILTWAALTTLFLQVLSNLANDYGDAVSGVDNEHRAGPARAVQTGAISRSAMLRAIVICGLLALGSGLWLLYLAESRIGRSATLVFLAIGLAAIAAAVKYTVGKKPYGYRGLGDIAVFVFFGLAGVAGTFFLHAGYLHWVHLLPAASLGLLATGVLNLNNMRDVKSDSISGKRSLVVMMGLEKARTYHTLLISVALLCAVAFSVLNYRSPYQFIFLISVPILYQNVRVVRTTARNSELDGELKKLAAGTLIFSITFGLGLIY